VDQFEQVEILLAEDNPADAELALRALRNGKLANSVVWVKDGSEALDFVLCQGAYAARPQRNPRLIVLDLKMPKVDGLEVLAKLKSEDHTKCIPVVIMTSSNHERDLVESYRLGVNSYIVKPVDFTQVVDVVGKAGFYWVAVNKVPE